MREEEIRLAYLEVRRTNNTIPDEVLDFMKNASIEKIQGYKAALSKEEVKGWKVSEGSDDEVVISRWIDGRLLQVIVSEDGTIARSIMGKKIAGSLEFTEPKEEFSWDEAWYEYLKDKSTRHATFDTWLQGNNYNLIKKAKTTT